MRGLAGLRVAVEGPAVRRDPPLPAGDDRLVLGHPEPALGNPAVDALGRRPGAEDAVLGQRGVVSVDLGAGRAAAAVVDVVWLCHPSRKDCAMQRPDLVQTLTARCRGPGVQNSVAESGEGCTTGLHGGGRGWRWQGRLPLSVHFVFSGDGRRGTLQHCHWSPFTLRRRVPQVLFRIFCNRNMKSGPRQQCFRICDSQTKF